MTYHQCYKLQPVWLSVFRLDPIACGKMSNSWSCPNSENWRYCLLFSVSPKLAGTSRISTSSLARQQAVSVRDICLQNVAKHAITKQPSDPAAGLGGAIGCTTTWLCTKKGRKARRREGDKCFFSNFFPVGVVFAPSERRALGITSLVCIVCILT